MPLFQADYVYPISSPPIKDGIVEVDTSGKIIKVFGTDEVAKLADHSNITRLEAGSILIPGFINTHCHLELSHLKGRVDTGTTLLPFLVGVVSLRETDQSEIDAAIADNDRYMWEQGIQAVGDICNKLDTAAVKAQSPIRYYSFVEMFDFLQPDRAAATFEQYEAVYKGQACENGNAKTAVPHAPYTVSDPLYEKINTLNAGKGVVSIHNQETPAEDQLFDDGQGPFPAFFEGFGATLEHFTPPGGSSMKYALARMDANNRTLLVHNTMTQATDIAFAQAWAKDGVYWATCPNANLYIENRLPRYQQFLDADAKVTIGTDSLTSNWQLSVLEELKTISKYQSYVPFETLLKWATLNGAEALYFDDDLGSLEAGKTPGLLALSGLEGQQPEDFRIGSDTVVKRIC